MYISKIEEVIHESDEIINVVVQQLLDRIKSKQTPAEWREDHYDGLRRLAYPNMAEFVDAQMKKSKHSKYGDKGAEEEEAYFVKVDQVKDKFPKKIVDN